MAPGRAQRARAQPDLLRSVTLYVAMRPRLDAISRLALASVPPVSLATAEPGEPGNACDPSEMILFKETQTYRTVSGAQDNSWYLAACASMAR